MSSAEEPASLSNVGATTISGTGGETRLGAVTDGSSQQVSSAGAGASTSLEESKQGGTSSGKEGSSSAPSQPPQRSIFSLKSKQMAARDRFSQKAQDYLESYKMSIYLQDAIKIILDRRDEKPLDLLNEYFNTTLRGEHILLREYAFVSATQLNRKSFLQQVKKVFHSTPHYKVITALDYQQMICLVCSDFPRNLIIETVKTLPIAGQTGAATPEASISSRQGHDLLFEQYDIEKLQGAVCIYFYYNEFMENVRTLFQESSSQSTLNINEQCSLYLIYTSINNLVQRLKPCAQPLPPIEAIMEVLITKASPEAQEKLLNSPLTLVSDLTQSLSGFTISYLEFSQGMIMNKTLLRDIYEPVYNPRNYQNYEKLKEIASEQASSALLHATQIKKTNKKKMKK